MELHAVIVKKPITLKDAKKKASNFTDKSYYRETDTSYRFRNIPKTKFERNSFRSKPIGEDLTLVYGKLN
jgi:hypothetical protein